eukprot:gb/GECG01003198.1/.p1 GENE.gb/GECG01003198.1/~~gb/GECG01003198.1/.p1  ORF type:complete len:558 (+),score=86.24 gb/GECG01003198.1/:1-1674(+)
MTESVSQQQQRGPQARRDEITQNMRVSSQAEMDELMKSGKKPAAKYKTKICIFWLQPGGCPYGDDCFFAHGAHELRWDKTGTCPGASPATNKKYKTKLCKHWLSSNGKYCPHGVRCVFAHGEHELRASDPNENGSPTNVSEGLATSSETAAVSTPEPATSIATQAVSSKSESGKTGTTPNPEVKPTEARNALLQKVESVSDGDLLKLVAQPTQTNGIANPEAKGMLASLLRDALVKVKNVDVSSGDTMSKADMENVCLQLVTLAVQEPLAFFERVSTLKVNYKETFLDSHNAAALEAASKLARAYLEWSGKIQRSGNPVKEKSNVDHQVPPGITTAAEAPMAVDYATVPLQHQQYMAPPGYTQGVLQNPHMQFAEMSTANAVPAQMNSTQMQQPTVPVSYRQGEVPVTGYSPTTTGHPQYKVGSGSSTQSRSGGMNEEEEASFMLRDIFSAVNLSSGEEEQSSENSFSRAMMANTWSWAPSLSNAQQQQQPSQAVGITSYGKNEPHFTRPANAAFQTNLDDSSPFSASLSPYSQEFEPFSIPLGYSVDPKTTNTSQL